MQNYLDNYEKTHEYLFNRRPSDIFKNQRHFLSHFKHTALMELF